MSADEGIVTKLIGTSKGKSLPLMRLSSNFERSSVQYFLRYFHIYKQKTIFIPINEGGGSHWDYPGPYGLLSFPRHC